MVAPVAVGADPDLEERRLVLLDRPVPGRGERLDPRPRPDEREAVRELDLAVEAGAVLVHPAVPDRARPRSRVMPGRKRAWTCSIAPRGDLVREPHPLDLLLGLDRADGVEERRRVRRLGKRVEPRLREGRRLADHPVGGLRPERELEADALVLGGELPRQVERPQRRRPRVALVVAAEEPHLLGPAHPRRRPPRTPRGRSGRGLPRGERRRRRSPSSPRSSSGRGRCRARGRRARRAPARPSPRARARASRRRAASSRARGTSC